MCVVSCNREPVSRCEPQPAVGAAPPRGARRLYMSFICGAGRVLAVIRLYFLLVGAGGRAGRSYPVGGSARHDIRMDSHATSAPAAGQARPRRVAAPSRRAWIPQERGGARGAATPRRTGRAGVLAVTEFTKPHRVSRSSEFYTQYGAFSGELRLVY